MKVNLLIYQLKDASIHGEIIEWGKKPFGDIHVQKNELIRKHNKICMMNTLWTTKEA